MQAAEQTPTTRQLMRQVRSRLQRVRSFDSIIQHASPDQHASGHVSGEAKPVSQDQCIRIEERGRLRLCASGRVVVSSNVYFWAFGDNSITLGHDRDQTGQVTPLVLFRLESAVRGEWLAETPHVCGADSYNARLALGDDSVALRWHVSGPAKDYSITTHYYATCEHARASTPPTVPA